ncbi:MAG: hypothetical protein HRT52_22255 [Colwellia sp.]|nr:hypothetical protein [Colwellia sp.]
MKDKYLKIKDSIALPVWGSGDTQTITNVSHGVVPSKDQCERLSYMLEELTNKISFKGTPSRVVNNHYKFMNDIHSIIKEGV